jgi:hypothetical protein
MLIAWRSPHIPSAGVGFPARRTPLISRWSTKDKPLRRWPAGNRRFERDPHPAPPSTADDTRMVHQ